MKNTFNFIFPHSSGRVSLITVTKFIKTGNADKNDYPLYFEKVIYEADIDENVEVNHNFLNVTAKTHAEGE